MTRRPAAPPISALFPVADRLQSLAYVAQTETEKLQGQRCIEGRACGTQPVIQGMFGPAHCGRAAGGEPPGGTERCRIDLRIIDAARHQADAFRLLSRERLVSEQVIAGLGQTAQQRPDDDRMIPSRDTEPRMPIENPDIAPGDSDVSQQRHRKSGTNCGAADCRDHGFGAVDAGCRPGRRLPSTLAPALPHR